VSQKTLSPVTRLTVWTSTTGGPRPPRAPAIDGWTPTTGGPRPSKVPVIDGWRWAAKLSSGGRLTLELMVARGDDDAVLKSAAKWVAVAVLFHRPTWNSRRNIRTPFVVIRLHVVGPSAKSTWSTVVETPWLCNIMIVYRFYNDVFFIFYVCVLIR